MNIFEEAKKLANQRYDRAKLLSTTAALITRFRLLHEDKSKMQGACRHLADALDRLRGSASGFPDAGLTRPFHGPRPSSESHRMQ